MTERQSVKELRFWNQKRNFPPRRNLKFEDNRLHSSALSWSRL